MLQDALEGQVGEVLVQLLQEHLDQQKDKLISIARPSAGSIDEVRYRSGVIDGLSLAIDIVDNARKGHAY